MNVLVLTKYGRLGASSRLRSLQYLPWWEAAGINAFVQPLINDSLLSRKYAVGSYGSLSVFKAYLERITVLINSRKFDVVWIEKEAFPWFPAVLERLLLARLPYVLDYDDALFHQYDMHNSKVVRALLGRRLDYLMAHASLVIGGNHYLSDRARMAGAQWVETIPTVIDLDRYKVRSLDSTDHAVPQLVWIGSPSTAKYLRALELPLQSLAKRRPFKLRVIGATVAMKNVDIECIRWAEDTEVEEIGLGNIGIMPLSDSPWERGKCGYKLIQYMAVGLPVVASPVGANLSIVGNGINGFLADSAVEWEERLEQLLADASLRNRMGSEGRSIVEKNYCVQRLAPRTIEMLRHLSTAAGEA